jgi:hypothetical protein
MHCDNFAQQHLAKALDTETLLQIGQNVSILEGCQDVGLISCRESDCPWRIVIKAEDYSTIVHHDKQILKQ